MNYVLSVHTTMDTTVEGSMTVIDMPARAGSSFLHLDFKLSSIFHSSSQVATSMFKLYIWTFNCPPE